MAARSKGDAEQLRRLARALYFSNETIEWFLASSSAAQLRAVVSVNIVFTIFANVFSPIAPTHMRRFRQCRCAAFGA